MSEALLRGGRQNLARNRHSRLWRHISYALFLIPEWYHNDMAFTVRTDEQMEEALTALAAAEGASRQEIIRRAVIERYERSGHAARVAGATEKMQSRWGDVLERLSKT